MDHIHTVASLVPLPLLFGQFRAENDGRRDKGTSSGCESHIVLWSRQLLLLHAGALDCNSLLQVVLSSALYIQVEGPIFQLGNSESIMPTVHPYSSLVQVLTWASEGSLSSSHSLGR